MIAHTDLGATPYTRSKAIRLLLNRQAITFAGNHKLKIYGTIQCASGRRMNDGHRVFFTDQAEAVATGYRPCGHCMRAAYLNWKALNLQKQSLSNNGDDL